MAQRDAGSGGSIRQTQAVAWYVISSDGHIAETAGGQVAGPGDWEMLADVAEVKQGIAANVAVTDI